jgi:uncharacterized membrane protein
METLQTLGTALGLSALAGIDLYITVFFTGLAIHLGWVQLAPQLQGLSVLGDPVVLVVAGVMLVVEFVIDKCPYADSGWDTIHTLVRPIGGAILGLKALGSVDPAMQVVGALLGGSVAFTTHATKAGTRLVANTSPEPFSNIVLSVGEDATVLGGLWFVFAHPVITLFLVIAFVTAFWYFFPKFFRMARAHATAILHRFHRPPMALPVIVPEFFTEKVEWALPCFSGRWKGLGRYVRGHLVATMPGRLFFVGRKNYRVCVREIALPNIRLQVEPAQLYHRLVLQTESGETIRLRFTRKYAPLLPGALRWVDATAVTSSASALRLSRGTPRDRLECESPYATTTRRP